MENPIEKAERKRLEFDLNYIDNELIAKLNNGNYCKFSRIMNKISVINKPKEDFYRYWRGQYHDTAKYKQIKDRLDLKFSTNLISAEDMIKLVEDSKDVDSEKKAVLRFLKPKKVRL